MVCDRSLSILGYFLLFYHPNSTKKQKLKKLKKKTPRDIISLRKCTKNHDHMPEFSLLGGWGSPLPPAKNLIIPPPPPPGKIPSLHTKFLFPPHRKSKNPPPPKINKNFQVIIVIFSSSHCSCTIFILIKITTPQVLTTQ